MSAAPVLKNPLPVRPFAAPPAGSVDLPGSKSITNRALLLAALGEGEIVLEGALFSRDTEIMVAALRRLGIRIAADRAAHRIRVEGRAGRIPVRSASVNVGNAGTAARFLTAMLALAPEGRFTLDGDPAMRERPMEGLLRALSEAGARFTFQGKPWHFPFEMRPNGLQGGALTVDAAASSQILSALLMVAPLAEAPLQILLAGETVSQPFVDMTRRMMAQFGVQPAAAPAVPRGPYRLPHSCGGTYFVEPDATASSYFLTIPAVAGGSVRLPAIRSQRGSLQGDSRFAELLAQHGIVTLSSDSGGWLTASPGPRRHGVSADFNAFSDTFLTLAAVAPLLDGPTGIEGIGHTRLQETDRIAAMANELRRLRQEVREEPDSLHLTPQPEALRAAAADARDQGGPIVIQTYEDHRMAMSFAILGSHDLLGDGEPWLAIADPGCCAKTFPGFFEVLDRLHAPMQD